MAEEKRTEYGHRRRVSGAVRINPSEGFAGGADKSGGINIEPVYSDPVRGRTVTQEDIESLRFHAYQWKEHFAPGMRVNIIESPEQVRDEGIRRQLEKRVRLNGWFDASTGGVSLYLPNIAIDSHPHLRLEKVLFHEVVGHGGLRLLLGDKAFEAYCLDVYAGMDHRERAHWIRSVQGDMSSRDDRVAAGAEYVAHLAEGLAYSGNPLSGPDGNRWNDMMDTLERNEPALKQGRGTILYRDVLHRTLALAMKTVAGRRRYQEPKGTKEEIGALFDREIESLKAMHAGVVPRQYGIVLKLGRAGDILLNSSPRVSDYPLELRTNALWGTRFDDKQERHPYSLDDVKGLVAALDSPLAVIESKDENKSRSVVAIIPRHTIDADGEKCTFVVPVTPCLNREGHPVLNIDSIYPKKDRDIAYWMSRSGFVLDSRTGRPLVNPNTGEPVKRNLLRYASDEFRNVWFPAASGQLLSHTSDVVNQAEKALLSFVADNIGEAAADPAAYAAELESGKTEPPDEQLLNAAELIGRLRDARALDERAGKASAYGAKVIENLERYNRMGEGMRLFSKETEDLYVSSYEGLIEPSANTVFVFGSNPEGRHGAGAARVAVEQFGAVYGNGEGLQGNAYALLTKDLSKSRERGLYTASDSKWREMVAAVTKHYETNSYSDLMTDNPYPRSISPERIVDSIIQLYRTAEEHPDKVFKVAYTNGKDEFSLNGYCGGEMAAMFLQAGREHGIIPVNVQFSDRWVKEGLMKGYDEQFLLAPDGQPSSLSPELYDYVHSEAFIARHGDWTKKGYDGGLVLDGHGEPKVLWHGSSAKFDAFDMSHGGDNTGITEYTDNKRGETVRSDSEKAVFFTDNRLQAITYGFLGWTKKLSHINRSIDDTLYALLEQKASSDIRERITAMKAFDPALADILARVDETAERPFGSLPKEIRDEIGTALRDYRDDVLMQKYNLGHSSFVGSPISNMMRNALRQTEYFRFFRDNFDRIRHNDITMPTMDFGKGIKGRNNNEYTFENYSVSFDYPSVSRTESIFISAIQQEDGLSRFSITMPDGRNVYADQMTDSQVSELMDDVSAGLERLIQHVNDSLVEGGFLEHTHLYPVFLTVKNPLEHDYQWSTFPDKYRLNEKYPTAYVAARQNARAHADGNDGVIYRNIVDPFDGDTYGVFSTEQIEMINPSLMRTEDMDIRLSSAALVSDEVEKVTEQKSQRNDMNTTEKQFTDNKEANNSINTVTINGSVLSTPNGHSIDITKLAEEVRNLRVVKYMDPTRGDNCVCIINPPGIDDMREGDIYEAIRAMGYRESAGDINELCAATGLSPLELYLNSLEGNHWSHSVGEGDMWYRDGHSVEPVTVDEKTMTELMEKIPELESINNNTDMENENNPIQVKTGPEIRYTRSTGGYQQRTRENAQAPDVDLTFQIAVDFSTYGERATERAAGNRLVKIQIPDRPDSLASVVRSMADAVISSLPDEYRNGRPFGVNVAGNGIYTLARHGYSQEDCDNIVSAMFSVLKTDGINITSLRSGGQTGIDETAAAAAAYLGVPVTIHAPVDYAFRGSDGKDVRDEEAFRKRFDEKNYESLNYSVTGLALTVDMDTLSERINLAKDGHTSVENLTKLAEDREWQVRVEVAGNINTPAEVLIKLMEDDNDDVRQVATTTITERSQAQESISAAEETIQQEPVRSTSFSLPDSVSRTIPAYVVPEGTLTLAAGAFEDCTQLRQVILPEGLTSMRNNAFRNCSRLSRLNIPSTLAAIGSGAFINCASLKSIDIPDSVQSIGSNAFVGCDSLEEIRISSSAYERLKGSLPDDVSFTLTDIPDRQESQQEDSQETAEPEIRPREVRGPVVFMTSPSSGHRELTTENVRAADVTLAFAADFGTTAERFTKKTAGDAYIPVSIVYANHPNGAIAFEHDIETDAEDIERMIISISEKRGFDTDNVRLNITGNSISTLASHGISQYMADRYLTRMLSVINSRGKVRITSIRSGGQTGIDEAGIQAARALEIPATVLTPAGWTMRVEDASQANGFREISDENAFRNRFEKDVTWYNVPIGQTVNIYAGTGENAQLSNFAVRPFKLGGSDTEYASVEQAFQALKMQYSSEPIQEHRDSVLASIMATSDGAELRRLGRSIPALDIDAWDRDSENIMRVLIQESFRQNPEALQEMLSTAGYDITHRQDTGKWREAFPRAFMAARDNLIREAAQPEIETYRELANDLATEVVNGGNRFTPGDYMYVVLSKLPQADLGLLRHLASDIACQMHPTGFSPDVMDFHNKDIENFISDEAMKVAEAGVRKDTLVSALESGTEYNIVIERALLDGSADMRDSVLAAFEGDGEKLAAVTPVLDGWIARAEAVRNRAAANVQAPVEDEPAPEEEPDEAQSVSFENPESVWNGGVDPDWQEPVFAPVPEEEKGREMPQRAGRLYTLGLGNRSEADFVQLIPKDVTRVIDMRHYTTHDSCPWFNKSALRSRLVGMGRTYDHISSLSGKTKDRRFLFFGKNSEVDSKGNSIKIVDYDKYSQDRGYLKAKLALEAAIDRGEHILVLGPEANPVKGARALMLGQDLARDGYQTYHIDSDMRKKPRVRDQESVITAAIGGRTISGGDYTQLHFRSDGAFSKEEGIRLSERVSASDRDRRMTGEPNYGVSVTFDADASNDIDDVNRANVDSSDFTLVFTSERPSIREHRTLDYAGEHRSRKVNIPEDVDMLRDPGYQDRVAARIADRIADAVVYKALTGTGDVNMEDIRLHIEGSDLPHITSRFVENRAEATDLSGQDVKMLKNTGFDLADRSPLTQEAVNEFIAGVVSCINTRLERTMANEEFPEVSVNHHIGTIVSNFETGVGEAAVLAAQQLGLKPEVHHTRRCMLTFDNETLHGETRADEISFKQRAYMGLEKRKTSEQVEREMEERIAMHRIRQDAFATGLQSEHVVMLRSLGFGNPEILDMVDMAEQNSVIIKSADDLYEFICNCAACGISGAEKLTAEAVAEKYTYARDLIARSAEMGIAYTTVVSPDYPASMRNVARYDEKDTEVSVEVSDGVARTVTRDVTVKEGPPAVLWYKGNLNALDEPSVSLVGGGAWSDPNVGVTAREMASRLADNDVMTVAGSFDGPQGEAVQQAIDKGAKVAVMNDNPLNDTQQEGYVDEITRNNGLVMSENSIDKKSVRQSDRRSTRRNTFLMSAVSSTVLILDSTERTEPAVVGELAAAAVIIPAYAITKAVKHSREKKKREELAKNGVSDKNRVANDMEPSYVVGEDGEGMDAVVDSVAGGRTMAEKTAEVVEAVRFEGLGDVPIHTEQKPFRMLTCRDETVFLVEKNYVDVVAAIRSMYGEDARIEDPSKANRLYHDMMHRSVDYGHGSVEVISDNDMDGTRVQTPKPEFTNLYYVDGAVYTMSDAPDNTNGLDSRKVRSEDAEMFAMVRNAAVEMQRDMMRQAELEGFGMMKFANAFYPVIGRNSVDIYQGDALRARIGLSGNGIFTVRNMYPDINGELSHVAGSRRPVLSTKAVHTDGGGVDETTVKAIINEMKAWFFESNPYETEEYALADRETLDEMEEEMKQNYRQISRNNMEVLCEDAAKAISEGVLHEPGGESIDRTEVVAALLLKDTGLRDALVNIEGEIASIEFKLHELREQYNEMAGKDISVDRDAILKERAELTSMLEDKRDVREMLEKQRGLCRSQIEDISLSADVTRIEGDDKHTVLNVNGSTVDVAAPEQEVTEAVKDKASELIAKIQARVAVNLASRRRMESMFGVRQNVSSAERSSEKEYKDVMYENWEVSDEKKEEKDETKANGRADDLHVVSPLVNDRCIVSRDGRFAYADKDLNIVSDFYERLRPFTGEYGIACRESDGRFNFITKDGKEFFNVWLDSVNDPSEGFAVIRSGQLYNHFNMETGDLLSESWVPSARSFHEGWARIMAGDNDPKEVQGKYNYVNKSNELLTGKWYDYAEDFKNGSAVVTENGISRAVDVNGDVLGIVKADGGIIPENEKDMTNAIMPDTGKGISLK